MAGQNKLYIGAAIATLVVLVIGVVLLSRGNKTSEVAKTNPAEFLVRSDSQKIASASATVTLVEFGDYQCPACGAYFPLVKQVLKNFDGKVNFVYRNFPLDSHKNARPSAYAAEAAGLQNKFWQMYDKIYETQSAWSNLDDPQKVFDQYAKELGLDVNKFAVDVNSSAVLERIKRDLDDGKALAVNSTPTFYVNGEKISNPGSLEDFETIIKAAILKAPLPSPAEEGFHAHFDIKIYQAGKLIDLAQDEYQSKDEFIHLHDKNGNVVHIHKEGETLGNLFTSLKLTFGDTTRLYVNGATNQEFANYVPQDLDRILVTDATGDILLKQFGLVTDLGCIYSEKCPERGKPPAENCVGGLGTGCEE